MINKIKCSRRAYPTIIVLVVSFSSINPRMLSSELTTDVRQRNTKYISDLQRQVSPTYHGDGNGDGNGFIVLCMLRVNGKRINDTHQH